MPNSTRHRTHSKNGTNKPRSENMEHFSPDDEDKYLASAVKHGSALLGNNLRALHDERIRFMTKRLEKNIEVIERMTRSRSNFELMMLQQQWLAGMAGAYGEELTRLGHMTTNAAQDPASVSHRS